MSKCTHLIREEAGEAGPADSLAACVMEPRIQMAPIPEVEGSAYEVEPGRGSG